MVRRGEQNKHTFTREDQSPETNLAKCHSPLRLTPSRTRASGRLGKTTPRVCAVSQVVARNPSSLGRRSEFVRGRACSGAKQSEGKFILNQNRTSERKFGRLCGVWAVTLWFCHFGGFSDQKKDEEPSRSFEDLREILRVPSRTFRGLPQNFRGTFEILRVPSGEPPRNLRDPASSFEVLRKASNRSFAPKMGNLSKNSRYSPNGHNSPR